MYDILHGTADFFFDFKLGGGTDLTSIMINVGIFNPINWLIYIVPRDFIPYMLSYIVILKLVIASFIVYYSLNKIFTKVDNICFEGFNENEKRQVINYLNRINENLRKGEKDID